jgi:multisubunit Na+/H+ antiporter MnhB subunit
MDLVLYGLLGFVILGSIVALEMKNLLSAVIAIGVVGLGLSIVFLLLAAPDIAITQVVVEVIVVTVLIRATGRLRAEQPPPPRRGKAGLIGGAGLVLVVLGFLVAAVQALPPFGANRFALSTWYLQNAPDLTGATNVVTAILLDFRAYDTLGEATVILTAVVGTLAVLRRPARVPPPAPQPPAPAPPRGEASPAPADPEATRAKEVTHV